MRHALAAVLVAAAFTAATAPTASAEPPQVVDYRPPVEGGVVDPFRPPESDYAAGNRGVDFEVAPGEPVRAAAAGEVVFAGPVGGAVHVVVIHDDGLRTSLSFLASTHVRRGERVAAGEVVGVAGGPLHFGVRAGDVYLDPLELLRGLDPEVHLAPLETEDAGEREERAALTRLLRSIGRTGVAAARTGVAWARRGATPPLVGDADTLRAWMSVARTLAVPEAARLAMAAQAWFDRRNECTPQETQPPRPPTRRLLVLVGGLGSSGPDGASVFAFDHAAAGYRSEDVTRFSYLGGDARDHPYTPGDTQQPIALSARLLRATIREIAASHPGVPIDVVAHSQGGLVSRTALSLDPGDPLPVHTFVTLGTPHTGASLATAGTLFRATDLGDAVLDAAGRLNTGGIDPQSRSVRELSEGSDLVEWLRRQPLPSRTRVVSVAARTDLVVPSPDCRLDGAANAIVTVGGGLETLKAHDALPRSAAAVREVSLAVAGLAPTCESLADALTDALVGDGIEVAEDTVAAALGTVP